MKKNKEATGTKKTNRPGKKNVFAKPMLENPGFTLLMDGTLPSSGPIEVEGSQQAFAGRATLRALNFVLEKCSSFFMHESHEVRMKKPVDFTVGGVGQSDGCFKNKT